MTKVKFLNIFSIEDHSKFIFLQSLKHYNFAYIQDDLINESLFEYLCKYDHCAFVSFLLEKNIIDVNHITKKIINCNEFRLIVIFAYNSIFNKSLKIIFYLFQISI